MIAVIAAVALIAQASDLPPAPTPIPTPTPTPIGLWINPPRTVIIAIAPCAELLCGTVKWASAKARRDAAKGTDELIGASLLTGVRQKSDLKWEGKLFIPDRAMRVKAKIKLAPDGRLQVSGCAIGRMLCKSEYWSRTEEPLPALEYRP